MAVGSLAAMSVNVTTKKTTRQMQNRQVSA